MRSRPELISKPWCPFCGMDVARPSFGTQRKMLEFPMGTCECGAVYVAEATGHNIGAAMVECLVNACNEQWELAWELDPEEDYLTGLLEDYDEVSHQVVPTRNLDGRAVRGVLYFVRMNQEPAELVQRYEQKTKAAPTAGRQEGAGQSEPVKPSTSPTRHEKRDKQKADKKLVRELAQRVDIDALVALYFDDRRVLRYLQRLLYEPNPDVRYRTAWVIGQVSGRVADHEPGAIADLLHRLFAACADSAATSWGMLETIGAVIAARPDIYGAFTRHLYSYMGDPARREAVLWGLGEIADAKPELIRTIPFYSLFPVLNHPNPVLRGLTLRMLGRIRAKEAGFQIMGLQHDTTPITIYEKGQPLETTVADLSVQATEIIHKEDADEQ